jgi:dienelactone hydrolase
VTLAAASFSFAQVCAARTFNVLPIVEHVYDMGNLAAVCRSADGERKGGMGWCWGGGVVLLCKCE